MALSHLKNGYVNTLGSWRLDLGEGVLTDVSHLEALCALQQNCSTPNDNSRYKCDEAVVRLSVENPYYWQPSLG